MAFEAQSGMATTVLWLDGGKKNSDVNLRTFSNEPNSGFCTIRSIKKNYLHRFSKQKVGRHSKPHIEEWGEGP
jgi:hypothetical protein